MSIELRLDGAGWLNILLKTAERDIVLECSYVSDTLGNLFGGLLRISTEGGRVEILCSRETEDSILSLRRISDEIEIVVKRVRDGQDDSGWTMFRRTGRSTKLSTRTVYRGRLELLRTISQLIRSWQAELDRRGLDCIQTEWEHPLPLTQVDALSAFLAAKGVVRDEAD